MTASIMVALIAAVAALVTSVISLVGQKRTAAYQNALTTEREKSSRAEVLQQIMLKYRQPLLQAATDLQSRLYNIVRGQFLQVYGRGSERGKRYAIHSTLFVFGEYFGWIEALRRDVQFLDMGSEDQNRKLQDCIEHITGEFLRDDLEKEFRLFRGQQRAIGEIMLTTRDSCISHECIGFAKFTVQLNDSATSDWFRSLEDDLDRLIERDSIVSSRISRIQWALVNLMDALDPDQLRVPSNRRDRLPVANHLGARVD